jgi:hypothetical protein
MLTTYYLAEGYWVIYFSTLAATNLQICFYSSDPTAKILIVGDEDRIPYMRPPLSKVGLPCSFWPSGFGSGSGRFRPLLFIKSLEKFQTNFFCKQTSFACHLMVNIHRSKYESAVLVLNIGSYV